MFANGIRSRQDENVGSSQQNHGSNRPGQLYDVARRPQGARGTQGKHSSDSRFALKSILRDTSNIAQDDRKPASSDKRNQQRFFSAPLPRQISLAAELSSLFANPVSSFHALHTGPSTIPSRPVAPRPRPRHRLVTPTPNINSDTHPLSLSHHALLLPPQEKASSAEHTSRSGTGRLSTLRDLLGSDSADTSQLREDDKALPLGALLDRPANITTNRHSGATHPQLAGLRKNNQALPIGTTRPAPFTSIRLKPQTHKVAYGKLVVLASCSIVVDFREGERKRKHKGNEVLLVDASGTTIEVFRCPYGSESNPHDFTTPSATYRLSELPAIYWRQYNDASRVVDQIKQRVPRLIMYDEDKRYTLMANEPCGDLEVLFSSKPEDGTKGHRGEPRNEEQDPEDIVMRIRLSRVRTSLEISRLVRLQEQSEWTKKTLVMGPRYSLPPSYSQTLSPIEASGIRDTLAFLKICETTENVSPDIPHHGDPLLATSLSPPSPSKDPVDGVPPFDSRFIPGVGWCIKYGSRPGGRYRLMFLDGVTLDVDVEQEVVELRGHAGEHMRHKVRECNAERKVGDRMKVFPEFISMFDDADSREER